MESIEFSENDRERLQRRIDFLSARASMHRQKVDGGELKQAHVLSEESTTRLACAGTLLRDAGASALLLGNHDVAKKFFREAGDIWSRLGLFAGYMLYRIADPKPWWEDRPEDLRLIGRALNPEQPGDAIEAEIFSLSDRPLFLSSATSGHQVFDLYRSIQNPSGSRPVWTRRERDEDLLTYIANRSHARLIESRVLIVSGRPMSMTVYLNLMEGLLSGELDGAQREAWLGLIIGRQEQILVARQDEFRWKHMANPAEIIDLDLFLLSLFAIEAGRGDLIEKQIEQRDQWVALPFSAAKAWSSYIFSAPSPGGGNGRNMPGGMLGAAG